LPKLKITKTDSFYTNLGTTGKCQVNAMFGTTKSLKTVMKRK
jgi:hypothetical protein